MAFFPGKQTAKPVSKPKKSSGGGGGGGSSGPTPFKTSPALSPEVNAQRMASNKARGVGDSQGRSPSDSNFGKGPTAPSSQFRSGGGASFKGGQVKTRVVSRAEFQRSLARKQQVSRSARKFLAPLQKERKRTGAIERRRRIDAVTEKQRLVQEIKGQPLSELGRRDKQAVIDYIDNQFEPFLKGKALFTTAASGKIVRNLDIRLRKLGTKAVTRRITPKEPKKFDKRPPSTLTETKKQKGLAGVRQTLSKQRDIARTTVETNKSQLKRTFTGVVVLGGLGLASGIIGVAEAIRHPVKTAKAQIEALRHPRETIRVLGQDFTADPVGVVAEFYSFAKTINLAGKGVKRSPAGRYVQEELFIRSQPKEIQQAVRKIIKAARIQEKINPLKIKSIRRVNFLEVISLNKIEAQALAKTLRNTDSVVFGSWAARTLGGKKLPKPKDVDLATANVNIFNKKFLDNLPSGSRKNYVVKGEKILRVEPGKAPTPILDVKPIERLIPQKSLITQRGRIPAVGYVRKVLGLERIRKVLRINKQISTLKNQIIKLNKSINKFTPNSKIIKIRSSSAALKRKLAKLEKQRSKEIKRFSPSELVEFKKVPAVGGLDFSTQKIVTVQGIKMVGFGEQTVRKALGTLQVLIEKEIRRQKDPSSLVKALEVQRAALKRSKKLTLFKKRKLKILSEAIRMLKSKEFSKLLEKKVPGLTKEYPLVAKINVKALKKVNFGKIEKEALSRAKIKPKGRSTERRKFKTAKAKKQAAKQKRARKRPPKRTAKPLSSSRRRVRKKKVSKPKVKRKRPAKRTQKPKASRLPKKKRARSSRLPSKLKRAKPSRLTPSRLSRLKSSKIKSSRPSRVRSSRSRSSKVGSSKPSKLKPSKISPSKVSKLKPSKLKPSRLRPSKLRPSRLTPSRIKSALKRLPRGTPPPPRNLLRKPKNKKMEERVIRWVKKQKQIYRPSLAAVLFNITGIPTRKLLTGFEIRPILVRRRIKKPKRLKRRTTLKKKKK